MKHDYEAVWRESGPTLWRAVRAYSGGRTDVADVAVSEAFARAMTRDDDIRDPLAYLYRIAFRVASAELREIVRHDELTERHAQRIAGPERNGDVWSALTALPPDQRAVLYLFYRADLPVREISRRLGRSSAAVRMHLVRGRRRLADLIEEDER